MLLVMIISLVGMFHFLSLQLQHIAPCQLGLSPAVSLCGPAGVRARARTCRWPWRTAWQPWTCSSGTSSRRRRRDSSAGERSVGPGSEWEAVTPEQVRTGS